VTRRVQAPCGDASRIVEAFDVIDSFKIELKRPRFNYGATLAAYCARSRSATPWILLLTGREDSRSSPRDFQIRMVACSRKFARHAWHDPCLISLEMENHRSHTRVTCVHVCRHVRYTYLSFISIVWPLMIISRCYLIAGAIKIVYYIFKSKVNS
jgi:hypothetical protein